MEGRLTYSCKTDTASMPKNELGFYCASCKKSVFDLTKKSDKEVADILQNAENKICLHIQKDRLHLVGSKRLRWQFLIVLILNIKVFFFNKLYAQSNVANSISNEKNTITRIIKGQITDTLTGEIVRTPFIEVFKNGESILYIKGDLHGNFEFSLTNSPLTGDTISLRINSWSHNGKIIENFPLKKIITVLNTTIPRNGQNTFFKNELEDNKIYGITWTGTRCSNPKSIKKDLDVKK